LVKYFKSLILAIVGAAAMTVPTIASPIGFNGAYDYATTWSSSETYGGAVVSNIDPSQQTLTLFDPNSWPNTPVAPQEFDFTHPASASGIVSFHWSFDATADPSCCSGFNFYVNGTLYNLEGGDFANPGFRLIQPRDGQAHKRPSLLPRSRRAPLSRRAILALQ
jgi:hypothetical protein